jgi:DNA-binding transcriptional LysR family regulator
MATASLALALTLVLAGCDLPRDPERTADNVRSRGVLRLGMVAGEAPDPAAERQLATVARAHAAVVRRRSGPSEALLKALEDGEVDLVFGHFPADSPWAHYVHLGRVPGNLAEPPKDVSAPRFAFRNGENGWIMAVERARP